MATESSAERQRAHDVGNALHLVNSAIYTFDWFDEELSQQDRDSLGRALDDGLESLAALLTEGAAETFLLDVAAAEAVDEARSRGINVRTLAHASPAVRAHRTDLVEVLIGLLGSTCESGEAVLHVRTQTSDAFVSLARSRDDGTPRTISLRFLTH